MIAFVQHLWTEEEASLARHLHPLHSISAEDIARAEGRPLSEIQPTPDRLTSEKMSIDISGMFGGTPRSPEKKRYSLMPVFPGIYEMVLIGQDMESLSDWHRRFAELFEDLCKGCGHCAEICPEGALRMQIEDMDAAMKEILSRINNLVSIA